MSESTSENVGNDTVKKTDGEPGKKKKSNSGTVALVINIILTVILLIIGFKLGIFTSSENMEAFVKKAGVWAPLLFLLVQVVQVIFPIIPGGLTQAAGILLFGPLWGFILNYVGVCAGSCINFLLAKRYGRPYVERLVSEKAWGKYIKWLDSPKFGLFFAIAILLPVAPDDLLCLLAGLTPMKFKKFLYSFGLTAILTWLADMFLR